MNHSTTYYYMNLQEVCWGLHLIGRLGENIFKEIFMNLKQSPHKRAGTI